jgi:hypothetical protein
MIAPYPAIASATIRLRDLAYVRLSRSSSACVASSTETAFDLVMRDLYYTSARASIGLERIRENFVEGLPALLASAAWADSDRMGDGGDQVAQAARRPFVVRAPRACSGGRPRPVDRQRDRMDALPGRGVFAVHVIVSVPAE